MADMRCRYCGRSHFKPCFDRDDSRLLLVRCAFAAVYGGALGLMVFTAVWMLRAVYGS